MHSKRFIFMLISASMLMSIIGVFVVDAMSGLDGESNSSKIKFFQYKNELGAGGYDVVAFFNDSEAAEGSSEFSANFAGIPWHFQSAENRDLFIADPLRYIPQYGGHCAYGVAQGYLVRGAPDAWSIRDGKLYLNYNKNIRNAWLADAERFLRLSANNWTQLNN